MVDRRCRGNWTTNQPEESSTGRWLAVGVGWMVITWNAITHEKFLQSAAARVFALFFLADSQSLAGGSVDTTVIVWVTPTCRHLAGLLGAGVFCLPFHAAGEREQEFARHPDPVFR